MPTLFLISWAQEVIEYLRGLGMAGLFLVEALDASFLYLPFATEILLFISVRANSDDFSWMLYVIIAALGSMTGVLLLDLFARRIGEESLERYVKPNKIRRLKSRLQSHAGWTLFIISMMPPAFPFRVFIITAAALQSPRKKILFAVFLGRLIRFGCEAILILYFGQKFLDYMNAEVILYIAYTLMIIAAIGSLLFVYKVFSYR